VTRLPRDTRLMLAYELGTTLRNPTWVVFGVFQPLLWLVLFGPLLDRFAGGPPGAPAGDAIAGFAPGILVMLALFSALFVGFGLVADLRAGVLERYAVTPVSRLALVLGRVLRDVIMLLVQALILLGVAALMGLRPSLAGVTLTFALLTLIGAGASASSYALALAMRDEGALSSTLGFLSQPLMLLSGIVLPLTDAPGWLATLGKVNPFYWAVEAARDLIVGELASGTVLLGFGLTAALAVIALAWAAPAFRRVAA
jgi:ABC-2 type transport system permease protein